MCLFVLYVFVSLSAYDVSVFVSKSLLVGM